MVLSAIVEQLLVADATVQRTLLAPYTGVQSEELIWALKAAYNTHESADPTAAGRAAAVLSTWAAWQPDNAQLQAVATWTAGLAALDAGQLADAHTQLAAARDLFLASDQPHHAAATQVSYVRLLAMIGDDETALQWGQWALERFAEAADLVAAAKIEQNLGGLHFMRDRYQLAETFFRRALAHFTAAGDQKQMIQVQNNLATALTAQHQFREAATIYEEALAAASDASYTVTQAEIECNLGCLALFQGRFDQALDLLERSRRRYATLAMPHELAIADQEIADAYLELNLVPEAAAIYARITPIFVELGMPAEAARAYAYHGRAMLWQNNHAGAQQLLTQAHRLYQMLGSLVGQGMVRLYQAEADFLATDYEAAAAQAAQAIVELIPTSAWGRILQARWLYGETLRRLGELTAAQAYFADTLAMAKAKLIPQIAQRCHTALGQVALALGDVAAAEAAFHAAITLIETLRAPLPAEEFRIAYLSDKLTPYQELVRLCLADGTPSRIAEALGYVERARARSLADMLNAVHAPLAASTDPYAAALLARMERIREELNWYYSQLNRPDNAGTLRGPGALVVLQEAVQQRETMLLDLRRQWAPGANRPQESSYDFAVASLQTHLGAGTLLIEYFEVDETLMAFVVNKSAVQVVSLHCREGDVAHCLQQLRFQLDAMRYGGRSLLHHQTTLTARTRHHLAALYDYLLRPLEPLLGDGRLVIVPHRALHYVPFHALYNGSTYVIETRELCYTPSAAILHHCLAKPLRPLQRALLLGMPDDAAPRVADEIAELAMIFPAATIYLHDDATRAALRTAAPTVDLVHLACHGRFRSDNPLFSALQLADGWLTVHEAAQLQLNCNLVTLSACETGISGLAPGDEVLGLVRGFLLAGAPALLMSLWTVDDSATATFMHEFYRHLLAGNGAAAALRHAQCQLRITHPHPFFWAPFMLFGRWS